MREVLKKFARYFLLDQIAQGGMAEIYRARLAAADGAGRLMVIKRIQAGHGANSEFVQMFRSEIKVMMGFNHPNIVQLYDFGEEQNQPYISMELVDGKNLKQFLNRFTELKQDFPIELAAHIIEQAAYGLHYAHSFKDKISGEPLGVVHRDISPQNILIAYEGSVKVIDFGIAKANTNSEETRAGIIKGKPSYLSPEQISGEVLDGRSDLFSLGTVFWELLTGKKLFAGNNDLAVLKMIESCSTSVKPPSAVNPKVPKELDLIVMKCLVKQREKRYQTGEELQRALHKFLYAYAPDFDPADLGYRAKDLFKEEIVEDRKHIQKLNDKVEQLLSFELIHEGKTSFNLPGGAQDIPPLPPEAESTRAFKPVENVISHFAKGAPVQMEPTPIRAAPKPYAPPQQNLPAGVDLKKVLTGVAAASVIGILYLGLQFGSHLKSPLRSPERSTASFDPDPVAMPTLAPVAAPPTSIAESHDVQNTQKSVLLKLNMTPVGSLITVNGQRIDPQNPSLSVTLDTPLEIAIQRDGYKLFHRDFVLDSAQIGSLKEWGIDIALEPVRFGYLTIHTTPSADVTIMIDGTPWKKHTPLENEKLPVGTYSVQLKNDIVGMEKLLPVSIQDGRVVNIDTRLEIKD